MIGYTFESHYLDLPEGRVHCRIAGSSDGFPILFIHGLSNFSRDWEALDGLPEGLRLLAPDLPGFGDSFETANHAYPLKLMVDTMAQILTTFSSSPALVIGHSRGARLVLGLPKSYPDLVKALVLMDGAPGVPSDARMQVAQKIAGVPQEFSTITEAAEVLKSQFPAYSEEQFKERLQYYMRKTESGHFEVKRDLIYREEFKAVLEGKADPPKVGGPDWWGMLNEAPVPVTLIRAKQSLMISDNIFDKMCSLRPDLKTYDMDSGHNIPGDQPKELVQIIGKILTEIK